MKPMDVYELFNIRIIISKLKARLNHDVVFDASGITQGQKETSVVAEGVQKKYITVGEVGE